MSRSGDVTDSCGQARDVYGGWRGGGRCKTMLLLKFSVEH